MRGQWNIVLPSEFPSKINHICPGQKWNTLMTSVPCRKGCALARLLCLSTQAHRSCNMSDRAGQWDTNCILCCGWHWKQFHCKVYGLISTEPVCSTMEKATGSGLHSVTFTKGLNKLPSTTSWTSLGEYPARHFIKCLQTCFPGRIL